MPDLALDGFLMPLRILASTPQGAALLVVAIVALFVRLARR